MLHIVSEGNKMVLRFGMGLVKQHLLVADTERVGRISYTIQNVDFLTMNCQVS